MAVKLSSRLFNTGICLQSACRSPWRLQGSCRNLFTVEALGIDTYQKQRTRAEAQFAGMADKFRAKMQEFTLSESKNMIFTEDLKNILHLIENKPEDMTLVYQMMKRFNQQNKHLRFGNFAFGPVIMRMYHYLNEPTQALAAYKDPELEGLFDHSTTIQILCDLLFTHGMYQDVLDVFDIVHARHTQGQKYPRQVTILVSAACAKMNTVQSYEYALKMLNEMKEVGAHPVRRVVTYASQLALNQNAPQVALEILGTAHQANYVTVRNLKILIFVELNRTDDAFPILRYSIENESPEDHRKHSVCSDVIQKVGTAVERSGNKELALEFERINKALIATGQISEQTLDEMLNSDIEKAIDRDGGGFYRDGGEFNRDRGGFNRDQRGFQRQSVDQSFRIGQRIDFQPKRNPTYDRERQSLRHEY